MTSGLSTPESRHVADRSSEKATSKVDLNPSFTLPLVMAKSNIDLIGGRIQAPKDLVDELD